MSPGAETLQAAPLTVTNITLRNPVKTNVAILGQIAAWISLPPVAACGEPPPRPSSHAAGRSSPHGAGFRAAALPLPRFGPGVPLPGDSHLDHSAHFSSGRGALRHTRVGPPARSRAAWSGLFPGLVRFASGTVPPPKRRLTPHPDCGAFVLQALTPANQLLHSF